MNREDNDRLLIVDDEPMISSFLKELLADSGFLVRIAASGEDAITILASEPYDILITDLRMPGMDGMELISRARQQHPGLQCMLITGHGDLDTTAAAKRCGAVKCFCKPLNFDEIEEAVAQVRREKVKIGS